MSAARCVDCQRWPAAVGSRCATCDERAGRADADQRCLDCGATPRYARWLCHPCYDRHYKRGTLSGYDYGQRGTPPLPYVARAIQRRWAAERARVVAYEARRTAEWLAAHTKEEP